MMSKVKGLYFHVPFCSDICFYCDFAKVFYDEKLADEYLNVLASEVKSYQINYLDIESIYIGGGTPSCLNLKQLEVLFRIINAQAFLNLKEFTIEVNPESLTKEKIALFKQVGITRVSVGVQTFNDKYLKEINRKHTQSQVVDLIKELKANNFALSLDLMYGYHNQTIEEVKQDLMIIEQLEVDHLATYDLILEKGTVFHNNNYLKNDDVTLSEFIDDYLTNKLNYEHYEVSNYQKNGKYSRHNLLYWYNERYYGFGLGAGGFIDNYRYYNTRSITEYLKGNILYNKDYYETLKDYLIDEIMLSFRIYNGIDLKIFTKYQLEFENFFNITLAKNSDKLFIKDNKLYFTKQGQLFLNDIIIDFIQTVEENYDEN